MPGVPGSVVSILSGIPTSEAVEPLLLDLNILTVRGRYILEEADLSEDIKLLLHGRAFIVDREAVTEADSGSARTYYIAADKGQGLVIPARSMTISSENGALKYRWTDDGEKWTGWITLRNGLTDDYSPQMKDRFAEVQVYALSGSPLISLNASR